VEICASGEENPLQLAGTVLHELAHVLAGVEGKHGAAWKEQCHVLGLRKATARTTSYDDPEVWEEEMLAAVTALEAPQDGKPSIGGTSMRTGKTCGTGQKTQSTRLLLWECHCMKPVKLRAAKSDLHALCMDCGQIFSRPEGSVDAEA
jgi:hypothetical protein